MKKCIILSITVILVFGICGIASAQEGTETSAKVMESIVSQIKTLLDADNVLGSPLDFHGTTIIPVAGYGFGFGAGSGRGTNITGEQGAGAGGGGGGGLMPAGVLIISKDGEVKVMSVHKGIISEIISSITPIAIEAIKAEQMKAASEAENAEENTE